MAKHFFTSESVAEGHPDKSAILFPMQFLMQFLRRISMQELLVRQHVRPVLSALW